MGSPLSPPPQAPGGSCPLSCDLRVETGSCLPSSLLLISSLLMEINHTRLLPPSGCSGAYRCSLTLCHNLHEDSTMGPLRRHKGPGRAPKGFSLGHDMVLCSTLLPVAAPLRRRKAGDTRRLATPRKGRNAVGSQTLSRL